jgi:DNA-binding XRE family transcriptional regulator
MRILRKSALKSQADFARYCDFRASLPELRMDITAAQCRGARGLLGMTQGELAAASGVSLRTITHFEANERRPITPILVALRTALEDAGIEFIVENGGGPGVRLARRPRQPKK